MRSHQARMFFVFLAALALAACGGGSPSMPTTSNPAVAAQSTMSGPPIAAHATACWQFNNAKAGPVSADVTPRSIQLTLGVGTCSAPSTKLAEKDGELVNVSAPAGSIHVTLWNPSDADVSYTLRVTYFQ